MVVDGYDLVMLVYEEMLGWSEIMFGVIDYEKLFQVVKNYIVCFEVLIGVLVDIIFIGLDCNEIIVMCYLYDV